MDNNTEDKNNKKKVKDKDNKYRRIIIAFFIVLIFLLIIFFVLFFLIKCNGDKNNSSNEPEVSVEEKDYKNFYEHMLDTSNKYMEDTFLLDNYAGYINAVSYKSNTLFYSAITASYDEAAVFSITLTYASLEEVINTYNTSGLDLYSFAIDVDLYSKDTSKTTESHNEYRGINKLDVDKKCYTVTYKENNEYVSGINIFDKDDNLILTNKLEADNKSPLTYSLFKFLYLTPPYSR